MTYKKKEQTAQSRLAIGSIVHSPRLHISAQKDQQSAFLPPKLLHHNHTQGI